MQRLYEFCEVWENCDDKEFRDFYGKKMIKGEDFDSLTEDEIKKLNELCKKCKHALKIEEKKCPVCGNRDLQPPKRISGGEAGSLEVFNHRCENCDRVLYSHKKL